MAKDWAPVHDEIRRLYEEEGKPLPEVMRIVRGRFGFIASERSYRTQLKAWGYTKYSTQSSPKPAKKKAKVATVLPQPSSRFHAVQAVTSQNDIPGPSNIPTSIPDFSSFGFERLFSHDASPSGVLPSYNQFSLGNHLSATPQTFAPPAQRPDGKTPLHEAVIEKNLDLVKTLLHSGSPVDIKDISGNTPLHFGVLANDYEIVKLLIRFGADITSKGQYGRSPLHSAVVIAHATRSTQPPPLFPLALRSPSTKILDLLIKEGAETISQDDKGDTPMHLALVDPILDKNTAYSPKLDPVIDKLLKAKPHLNVPNNLGITPLFKLFDETPPLTAASYELVSLFVKAGAKPTVSLPDGTTPMASFFRTSSKEWATKERFQLGRDWMLRRAFLDLLEAGAPLNTRTSSGKPLVVDYFRNFYTCWNSNLSLAGTICELCPPDMTFEEGNTILHEVVANRVPKSGRHCGTVGLIDLIVGKGANINQQNDRGETPLMGMLTGKTVISSSSSSLAEQALSALLRYGADPRIVDYKKNHVIFQVVRKFAKDSQSLLLPLFRAYISMMVNEGVDVENSGAQAPTAEAEWLSWWENAVRQQSWEAARAQMIKHLGVDGVNLGTEVVRMAYTVLAEHLVQVVMEKHGDGSLEKDNARSRVSEILRTCRERNLPVDMRAYDSLLELC
ncbi:ankyrin repeat-containing domain protein [Schizothecium vesticola]|uniref:Ankyrin repeat-containing domain protein n=1 Tax=Schizothecium vesticola TaxID=314040 RepID=A0AA40F1R9_9PEZI|nr:ankyrin repeat-containing domain protein [Schizothecium vesticola]